MPIHASSDAEDIETFTRALAGGRLLLRRCGACGKAHHYPRSYCPLCGGGDTRWSEASGDGAVYSFTRWRQRESVTVPAFVALDEGPVIPAMLAGAGEDIAIGDKVRLAETQDKAPLALFALLPAKDNS